MPRPFRRLFEGPDEIDYAPDPMGRVGAGMQEIHDPTDDPRGNELFQDFRDAWAEGHDLPDLFGHDGMLDIKEPVGPVARNRRPDVAKLETFLDALGAHDAARTDGPTGYYGIGFEDNLKAYQARNGLTPDGLVNPDGETIGRIKQDLTATLGPDRLDRPILDAAPRGARPMVSRGATPRPSTKEPPPPLPARVIEVAASGDGTERRLTPAPLAQRKTNPLIIDYENTWLAAQQRTSPHVFGPDGTLNYQKASDAWQRYYKRYGEVYQDVFVILIDPRNGEPTVWLRNPEMHESGLLGFARVFTWLALPGKLTNAPKFAQAARVGAKPALIQRARVDIAKFLRLRKAKDIVAAHIMRIPANRVKRADIAEAINEWLKLRRGSKVLTGRERAAFEILVTQLQKSRLPDGSALTVGQLFGLSLLLALKAGNQPLIPPPPVNVPRPLFDPDRA